MSLQPSNPALANHRLLLRARTHFAIGEKQRHDRISLLIRYFRLTPELISQNRNPQLIETTGLAPDAGGIGTIRSLQGDLCHLLTEFELMADARVIDSIHPGLGCFVHLVTSIGLPPDSGIIGILEVALNP
jgi:hypothetical protein